MELENGYIRAEDGVARPSWAVSSPQMREYYDTEWGYPPVDERELFEQLSLETFQVGLSWSLILKRRAQLREAFANFDVDEVASWGEDRIDAILDAPGMIRNLRKVAAVLTNARAMQRIRADGGLYRVLRRLIPPNVTKPAHIDDIPTQTDYSKRAAKALKERGFTMVGPVNVFALMQSTGLVNCRL